VKKEVDDLLRRQFLLDASRMSVEKRTASDIMDPAVDDSWTGGERWQRAGLWRLAKIRRVLRPASLISVVALAAIVALYEQAHTAALDAASRPVASIDVISRMGGPGLNHAQRMGYVTAPHVMATDNGITLEISAIYYDRDELDIGYIMRTAMPVEADVSTRIYPERVAFTINGQSTSLNGWNMLGEQTTMGSRTAYGLDTLIPAIADPLPASFTLGIHVTQIGNVTGDWNLQAQVSRAATDSATQTWGVRGGATAPIDVTAVTVTPASTMIQVASRQRAARSSSLLALDFAGVSDKTAYRFAHFLSPIRGEPGQLSARFDLAPGADVRRMVLTLPQSAPTMMLGFESQLSSFPMTLPASTLGEITVTGMQTSTTGTQVDFTYQGDRVTALSGLHVSLTYGERSVPSLHGAEPVGSGVHHFAWAFPPLSGNGPASLSGQLPVLNPDAQKRAQQVVLTLGQNGVATEQTVPLSASSQTSTTG